MTNQVETRVIDGVRYDIYLMPAARSVKVLTRLLKIIGEPIGLLAGSEKNLLDVELNSDIVGRSVKALVEKLDEDSVLNTIKEILEPVHRDGRKILFETDFAGRIGHLIKVVKAALEVNYSDFFAGASGLLAYVGSRGQTTTQASQT